MKKKFVLECLGACALGILIAVLVLGTALTQPTVKKNLEGDVTSIEEANGIEVPLDSERAAEILGGQYDLVVSS